MTQKELWTMIDKEVKNFVRGTGRNLVTSLIKKRRYLEEVDIVSELTINLIQGLTDKPSKKLNKSFFNLALKRDLLNWIQSNNRQRRDEGYTTPYVEEVNDDEFPTNMFEIQTESPTSEDILITKQLYEYAIEFFGEDDFDILLGNLTREERAEELNITYRTYCSRLSKKVKEFKIMAKKEGYV